MGNNYKKKVAKRKQAEPVAAEAPHHTPARLGVLKVSPKTVNQKLYLDAMDKYKLVFGIGPAGTGKTFLSVAKAVQWLQHKDNRVVLVRPAVEAGERLGFLPGSMQEKVDPYLRPIYDALFDMMPPQQVEHYMEIGRIEIAALAFMRGRAQPLRSRILTPTGWRLMGELEVGDYVIGSDGSPALIEGVFPQGMKPVYRVVATDGAETLASDEHLWSVRTASDKRRGRPARVLQTSELVGNLKVHHQYRYELPLLSSPVNFGFHHVPLDSYLLGALLGDGCITGRTSPSFTTADSVDILSPYLDWMKVVVRPKSEIDYSIVNPRGNSRKENPLNTILRELGLLGTYSYTKFVPTSYLYNSTEVRLGVLQGLLDTDGDVCIQKGRAPRVSYSTTSEQLKDDVIFIVRSLGGTASWRLRKRESKKPGNINGVPIMHRRDSYHLNLRLPHGLAPFKLRRKQKIYDSCAPSNPVRSVKSIEFVGNEETQCIKVSAPDSLYVTDDFILTHNTFNNSFVIFDEAQNSTKEQMKMMVTRIGANSKMVVNGDDTQIDLVVKHKSGLFDAEKVLRDKSENIFFQDFEEVDIVRDPLVQEICGLYADAEEAEEDAGA